MLKMNIGEHWCSRWTLVNIKVWCALPEVADPRVWGSEVERKSRECGGDHIDHLVIILWSSWSFVDPQMRFMDIEDELKVVGQNQQTLEVDFLFIKWLGWYDGRWEPNFIIRNKFLWWWPILSDRINNLEIFLDFQLISFLSGSKSIFLFDRPFEELKKAPFHLFNDVWKIWKDFF